MINKVLDFAAYFKNKPGFDFKVGYWLVYPYTEGLIESPLGRNVTKETGRLDAVLHHMEVCAYLLPKIFPDKNFSYHAQRLEDFKTFLNK